ncbi:MAG: cation diffusion facilitator family transporter [Clostridiales bacterium]|nr:cation diffusion facilitator family transporter [Clostridiales bacterium]
MTRFFIEKIKKKSADKQARSEAGALVSGGASVCANILLFIFKIAAGAISGAVSIISDAFNNLSDAAGGLITIFGTKMSKKPVDDEHPFGHGRMEYISAMIVSFFILIMGFELAKSSVEKIITPTDVKFSTLSLIIMAGAVVVKLWLAFFNDRLYKFTGNINMKAVKTDSLSDCITTLGAVAAFLISSFTSFSRADGIIGIVISIIIFAEGCKLLGEIISNLLGKAPDKELVSSIEKTILEADGIYGVHDIIIHSYGANKYFASAHAEVSAGADIVSVHNIIDAVEKKISREQKLMICIHMDPVEVDNEKLLSAKAQAEKIIKNYDLNFSLHDFRMAEKGGHKSYIFDLVIPHNYKKDNRQILDELGEIFAAQDENIKPVITIEHSFV